LEYLLEYILELGTDLRKENRYNETSLFATCKKKKSENEPIVPYLIELGVEKKKKKKKKKKKLIW